MKEGYVAISSAFLAVLLICPAQAGCNSGNVGQSSLLASAGCQGTAAGSGALAVGQYSTAPSTLSTAIGHESQATGQQTTAAGGHSTANGLGSTALGYLAGQGASADGYTALGSGAGYQAGPYSTAVGLSAWAKGGFSVSIGGGDSITSSPGARANGYRSISIGQMSSTGNAGTLTGFGLGDFGTSVGFNTHTAFAATAIGTDAQAKGSSASALGRFSNASGLNSLALGVAATASQTRSVAIGSSSVANVADTVSVGNGSYRRRIVNVAAGVNGTDVPTLAQVKSLIAAATAAPAISGADNSSGVQDLRREIAQLRTVLAQQQEEIRSLKAAGATAIAGR